MSKPTNNEQPVVCLISLGCAKNTVDSERILGLLASSGFLIAEDPADAQLCLVNTCGFIQMHAKKPPPCCVNCPN